MNYHIIQADKSRQENVDDIEIILGPGRIKIPVINGLEKMILDFFYISNPEFKVTGKKLNKGEVGCFASHYLSWKYIVDNNLENLLILEDDAILEENFIKKFTALKNNLPKNYDMFFLYVDREMEKKFSIKKHYINNYLICRAYQDWSTLAYLISNSGAKKALDLVHAYGAYSPVDNFILENNTLNIYAPKPPNLLPISINKKYKSMIRVRPNV